jgi:hypothetical protein
VRLRSSPRRRPQHCHPKRGEPRLGRKRLPEEHPKNEESGNQSAVEYRLFCKSLVSVRRISSEFPVDPWNLILLSAVTVVVFVRWFPHPTSAKSVERRIREYRKHHTNPLHYRRTHRRRTPRPFRDHLVRFCGGIVFPAYPRFRDRTMSWAGDFRRTSKHQS